MMRIWPAILAIALSAASTGLLYADDAGGITLTGPQPSAPAPVPATQPAPPSAPVPATNSADAALNNLLNTTTPAAPAPAATPTNEAASPNVTPPVPGVAPVQPPVNRLREGQPFWNRVGRLIKDTAGTGYLFAFESDGKTLQDPPMPLVPCRMLEQMEAASGGATIATKFKISGQVTEYHSKNYLLINFMQTVKDLGRGLD
jgi:hypothetical protein